MTKRPLFAGRRAISSTRSSASSSTSSQKSAASTKSLVRSAALSVADALVACCNTPDPEKSSSKVSFGSSESPSPGKSYKKFLSSSRGSSGDSPHTRDPGSVKFTIEEIHKATRKFSPSLKIGQGEYGTVYKGRLENGTLVAVKRANKVADEHLLGTVFQTEVQTLAQIEHLNLVKLFGYLEHGDERILVVEYVPNGTLREHLDCMHSNILGFASRLDIAIDVAHAVTYLHMYTDHPIIHRDIKSSNILLTENLRAKVADFGFARLAADRETGATHVSTQVKGTAGYLDPEYLLTFQLTEKTDVYSFGVLLVELVTGRRPIELELHEKITVKWALKKFRSGDSISALDPRLERSPENKFAIEKIFELSMQCLAANRHSRPTMKKCQETLWSIRKDYSELRASEMIT